jgi:hypothetical protein
MRADIIAQNKRSFEPQGAGFEHFGFALDDGLPSTLRAASTPQDRQRKPFE